MRMRRKTHLEERLAACEETGKLKIIWCEDRNFEEAVKVKELFDFEKMFGNNNPVHLEIGCGKGQFACDLATRYPDINVLAVEKTSNVIVDAAEKAIALNIPNLMLLRCEAEYLEKFIPEHSIERIYLNFSCPFPKKSYAIHRLTHSRFLKIYEKLLKEGAEIHQKTDNKGLFEFSLNELSGYGFTLKNVSLDLHASDFKGNIMTEYEKRFSEMGQPIYRLEAYLRR
ncbi:MAG: tRNA (guanosine(46)-N7)-methyltransferase TrmB [Oscillospiraceae bacterium]|nr:tRNA (guanosine(46)-N7)-methyltransferase TrmB [Oscillospiraceae bacterium]